MQRLVEMTDRLASAALIARPADSQSLVELQRQLRAVAQVAVEECQSPEQTFSDLLRTAEETECLLGRLLSNELSDADSALRAACEFVEQLQRWVEQAARPVRTCLPPAEQALSIEAPPRPHAATAESCAIAVEVEPPIATDDLPLILEFITEARGHLETAEVETLKLEQDPGDMEAINAVFRSFHSIKGVAGFLNLKQIGALAHGAENVLNLVRHEELRLSEAVFNLVLEANDQMKLLVDALDAAATLKAPIAWQTNLADLLLRLAAADSGPDGKEQAPTPAVRAPGGDRTQPEPKTAHLPRSAGGGTTRVSTDRVDSLVNLVGELVVAHGMALEEVESTAKDGGRVARNLSRLGKLTHELQALSMSLRMAPIQGVFRNMARLARDLARASQKEVDFITSGGETELDRNLIEAISDPLMHMVRNAIDHGIEAPDIRERAVKPRVGRIQLAAHQQGGHIVIEISDDGRGLDKERIQRKAIEAGIVQEGQTLSEQEIFHLIFHPGLSTAERVTEISGRGVGMDVVRKNLGALRGRIDIQSAEGKGSVFTVRLPLTLAVIEGLVVGVGGQRYVIPMTSIEQSIRPRPDQLSTVHSHGEVCLVRGRALPLFRLHEIFGVADAVEEPTTALLVIVEGNGRRCCLMVDELLGQQQVLVKPLGAGIGAVPGLSGGAILGDGNVSLILDVPALMEMACVNRVKPIRAELKE